MKRKNKKLFLILFIIMVIIAALLDLKYEGLFYQMLPDSMQSTLKTIFNG